MNPEDTQQPTTGQPLETSTPSPLRQIRTFQGDIAHALSSQKESLYSIQQKERLATGFSVAEEKPASSRGEPLLLFLGSLVLLALAGFGGWYTYDEFIRKTSAPEISAPGSRLISAESSSNLNITPLSRGEIISQINTLPTEAGGLRHIILRDGEGETASTTRAATFLAKFGSRAPSALIRALKPDFMLGALGESRFLIFKLSSFENAFAGMLTWETTLAEDLEGLFLKPVIAEGETLNLKFVDVIYRNQDLRALQNTEGPYLLYAFYDEETLIITDKLETLGQLTERLTREKLTR